MNRPISEKPIIALGPWLTSPAGSYVRRWEEAQLALLTADIFGFNAVQIGLPEIDGLGASRMPHRWIADTAIPRDNKLQAVVVHAGPPERRLEVVDGRCRGGAGHWVQGTHSQQQGEGECLHGCLH